MTSATATMTPCIATPQALQTIIAHAKSGKGHFYSFISMAGGSVRFVDSHNQSIHRATFDVEHLTPPQHDDLARTIMRQCLDQSYTSAPIAPITQYSPGFTRPVVDMDIKAYYDDSAQKPTSEPRWAREIDARMIEYCRLLQLSMVSSQPLGVCEPSSVFRPLAQK